MLTTPPPAAVRPRAGLISVDQVLEPHQRDIGGLDEPVRRLPVSLEEVLDGADAVGAAVGIGTR